MVYVVGYLCALLVFGAADAVWLSTVGPALYKPVLGDILLADVRLGPAVAFYAMYPVGILVFAVLPGLRSGSVGTALVLGLLFGAISGLLLFILFLLAGVIVFHGAPVLTTLTRLAVMVLAGAIGGLLSVSKKSKIK